MEVKHVHPPYHTAQQRLDKLKEIHAACLAAVAQLRGKTTLSCGLRSV